MQTVLEQGSIDKPLTFDVGLIQLSFIPVCSLNTCNISVKLCRGFAALQCFSFTKVTLKICNYWPMNTIILVAIAMEVPPVYLLEKSGADPGLTVGGG